MKTEYLINNKFISSGLVEWIYNPEGMADDVMPGFANPERVK